MPKRPFRVVLFALSYSAALAIAQEQPQSQDRPVPAAEPALAMPSAVDAPSIAEVQERIAQVEANAELSQAEKDAMLGPLRAALDALQRRDAAEAERQQFADATASAPNAIEQLRDELDQPVVATPLEDFSQRPPDAALDAIRALLSDAQARLDAAQAEQTRLQAEAAQREVRLAEAPALLVQWRDELTETLAELAALPADTADAAAIARRWRKQAEAAQLAASIARLEAEVASYTARKDTLPLRQTLAQRKADAASRQIDQLRNAETAASNRKARQAQEQAQQQAAEVADAQLQALARETGELAAKRLGDQGTLARLESVRNQHDRAEQQLSELQRRVRNTTARVQAAGLTELVGRALRAELRNLPEVDPEAQERLNAKMGDAQLELIAIEDKLVEFRDVGAAKARARERMADGDEPLAPGVEQQISSIIDGYVETLRTLQSEYRTFYEEALNLEATRTTLSETTEAFRTYIEERILWTRSVQGPIVPTIDDTKRGAEWLLGGGRSAPGERLASGRVALGSRWIAALEQLWPPSVLAVLALVALVASLWARNRARRAIKAIAAKVRRFSTDRMDLTLRVIPLTILVGLPLPIALLLAGLLLTGTQVEVAQSVGRALFDTAVFAFILEFARHAARTDGLLEAHFRWRREGLAHWRRLVFLLEVSILPVAVIAQAFEHLGDVAMNDSIGRMAFIVAELMLAVFVAWAFAPWLPFVRSYLSKHPGGFANQTRWAWFLLLTAAPLALAVLAAVGYHYTARQLDARLHLSSWLVMAAAIAYNLVLRWLFIERRKLLVKRAEQKRLAEDAEPAGGGEVEGIEFEAPPEIDAAEVDTQTRRVLVAAVLVGLVVGMYALWAEQLPALRMLDRVQLYPQLAFTPSDAGAVTPGLTETVPEQAAEQPGEGRPADSGGGNPLVPGSGSEPAESEAIGAITLADVGGAFLFFALTYVLARNLPGLLEITILKRLPLDSGSRFAVTSILRYLLVIIGILLGFGAIGIGWSQVQFLAAALTFGLAFGLQEIFANFISGLIILVERPVRVGDTVSVGGRDGRVTRIRMRATTVLDWELRELIIPNKVFITDQFINWTLSDPRIRLTIPVGVAYGSDVRLVERTLLEIGQSQDHVVAEPRVRSVFSGFGDSTLNFELRVYLEHFDYFLDAKTALHMRIAERFHELDIEIAFPQRDLNIRNIGPLADALASRTPARDLPPPDAAPGAGGAPGATP